MGVSDRFKVCRASQPVKVGSAKFLHWYIVSVSRELLFKVGRTILLHVASNSEVSAGQPSTASAMDVSVNCSACITKRR